MTGGAAMKRKGTRREYDVVDSYLADGWLAFRSMGSLGPADVIAMRAGEQPHLVQVKAGKLRSRWSAFPPSERTALSIAARKAGAKAFACFWRDYEASPEMIGEADWPAPSKRGQPDYAVDPETGCWIWQKRLSEDGYGICRRGNRTHLAHRFYYTQDKGPIPRGLEIDHLCRVRACVNPEHLEAVTRTVNVRRTSILKLSDRAVREIRAAEGSNAEIARQFGVTRGWVYRIRKGQKRVAA